MKCKRRWSPSGPGADFRLIAGQFWPRMPTSKRSRLLVDVEIGGISPPTKFRKTSRSLRKTYSVWPARTIRRAFTRVWLTCWRVCRALRSAPISRRGAEGGRLVSSLSEAGRQFARNGTRRDAAEGGDARHPARPASAGLWRAPLSAGSDREAHHEVTHSTCEGVLLEIDLATSRLQIGFQNERARLTRHKMKLFCHSGIVQK